MQNSNIIKTYADLIKNAAGVEDNPFGGGSGGGNKIPAKPAIKPQVKSQSKIAIENMQKAMLAFRDEFSSMAIGSNQVGRKETGETVGDFNSNSEVFKDIIPQIQKRINESKLELTSLQKNPKDNKQKIDQLERLIATLESEKQKKEQSKNNPGGQRRDVQGLRPLGQILLNDYIGKNALQGVTYTSTDVQQPNRMTEDTGQVDNQEFAGIISSIGRVGTPSNIPAREESAQEKSLKDQIKRVNPYSQQAKNLQSRLSILKDSLNKKHEEDYHKKHPEAKGEESTDGIWDVRTNNSLRNISAIMKGILAFSNDMQIKTEGYTESDLESFNKYVPDEPKLLFNRIKQRYPKRIGEAIKGYCAVLQEHIEAQTRYLGNFKRVVFKSEKYNQYLTQNEALYSFDKSPDKQNHEEQRKKLVGEPGEDKVVENPDGTKRVVRTRGKTFIPNNTPTSKYIKNYFNKFDAESHGAGLLANIDGKQVQVTYQSLSTFPGLEQLYTSVYGKAPETKQEMVDFVSKIRESANTFKEQSAYVAPNQDYITRYKTEKETKPNSWLSILPKRTEYKSQPYQVPYNPDNTKQ